MPAEFSFYDILGLEASASAADIKSAYHAAVKKYHPDVNAAPNAQRLTAMLNEAYSVLSDPAQRAEYDRALESGSAPTQAGESASETWDLFVCDRCSKVDPNLRFATFFRVWSILIFTQMKGVGGVLCPPCRSHFATTTALFSGILGAWGFPWGIIYTIRALAASIRGGEMKRLENGQLLRHLGIAFAQRGYFSESRTAFTDSLTFEKNPAVNETLKSSEFVSASIIQKPRWLRGQTVGLASLLLPFIIFFAVGAMLASGEKTPATASSGAQITSANSSDDATPVPAATKPPCLDPKTKLRAQALYDQCASVRTEIHDYVLKSTSEKDIESYHMLAALAEYAQAYGALGAKRSDAKSLADEAVASLNDLRSSAKDDDVRKAAGRYYNCYALDQCK
jgi:curved DNA-binding protein CbpA